MPFGVDESQGYGLIDVWCKNPKKAERYKSYVEYTLDVFYVGGVGALMAVAYQSAKDGVCSYGARRVARYACLTFLSPAATATLGSVVSGWSAIDKTTKVYKTGSFLWNTGTFVLKGTCLPAEGVCLLLNGRGYIPLVHNTTLLNSTNTTAISEDIIDAATHINMTGMKEILPS